MADVEIYKLTESTVGLQANDRISRELNNFFTIFADNYRWSPKYKSGFWDGKLRFMRFDNSLPIGLVDRVTQFAKKGGYTVKFMYQRTNNIDPLEFRKFIEVLAKDLPPEIKIRPYQVQAAYDACNENHLSIESVTSSGKSLIIYFIIRFLEKIKKKIILVVPRVQLVQQMWGDFEEYGWKEAYKKIHLIYSGQKKVFNAPVIVSTWQSLYTNKELFEEFDCLMIDEAHNAKAKSLRDIGDSCINAQFRFGLSGTYPDDYTAAWHTIVGNLGPIRKYSSYASLQKEGHIAKVKIYGVKLSYNKKFRETLFRHSQGDYHIETDELIQHEGRTRIIADLVAKTKGNTIVLFTKIEKHGKKLRKECEKIKNKQVFYIDGSTPIEEREEIRAIAETTDDILILASYGTFSEGINIKRIHNIVFASSYKSKIKVLQSLGRGLRKYLSKILKVYDIVDNVVTKNKRGKNHINHSIRHFRQRKKLYKKQGFPLKEIIVKVN